MNEQNTPVTDTYTGPVWARYVGDIVSATLIRIDGKAFFRLRGYDSLKELKGESDNSYFTVSEWWPRETWLTWLRAVYKSNPDGIGAVAPVLILLVGLVCLDIISAIVRFFH